MNQGVIKRRLGVALQHFQYDVRRRRLLQQAVVSGVAVDLTGHFIPTLERQLIIACRCFRRSRRLGRVVFTLVFLRRRLYQPNWVGQNAAAKFEGDHAIVWGDRFDNPGITLPVSNDRGQAAFGKLLEQAGRISVPGNDARADATNHRRLSQCAAYLIFPGFLKATLDERNRLGLIFCQCQTHTRHGFGQIEFAVFFKSKRFYPRIIRQLHRSRRLNHFKCSVAIHKESVPVLGAIFGLELADHRFRVLRRHHARQVGHGRMTLLNLDDCGCLLGGY